MSSPEYGRFPFGQPNSARPPRVASQPRAVVIGVYPSAFHVSWIAPAYTAGAGRTGKIRAMAVDVEPEVCWEGTDNSGAEMLKEWRTQVDFKEGDEEGQHGRIDSRLPVTNGSSGRKVKSHYLDPLGLNPEEVTFTDVYPLYMVKSGSKTKREMGDAIANEFDSVAKMMGLEKSSLPNRILPQRLPARVEPDFPGRLRAELYTALPDQVITLGEEAWKAVGLVFGTEAHSPVSVFDALYGGAYGRPGTLRLGNHVASWIPLVHPGLLLEKAAAEGTPNPSKRTIAGWNQLHARWEQKHRNA